MLGGKEREFAELQRWSNVADAARTPAERLADAAVLLGIAEGSRTGGSRSRTDEPPEAWRRLRERARRNA